MLVLLFLLTASYWYCLPVATQTVIAYSEFRGYDFLMLVLVAALLLKYWNELVGYFRTEGPGRSLILFSLWATATYPLTVILSAWSGRAFWAAVSLIFLFHLWGFVLAFVAIRIFVHRREQCLLLLDLFLVAGLIESIIIYLQAVGRIPGLWSELYAGYGAMAFSGTLGPNRTMPGHAMVLALGVALSYGRNLHTVGVRRAVLAGVTAMSSLVALGMSASRTAWLTCAVLLVMVLIGRRAQVSVIAFAMVIGMIGMALLPEAAEKQITQIYQWRVGAKLETPQDSRDEEADLLTTVNKLDGKRVFLWSAGINALVTQPWLLPFGGGFNNYRYSVNAGVSAHNLYITLVGELGLLGLFLYLKWMYGLWRESSALNAKINKRNLRDREARFFRPFETQALLAAFMVSLLAGEILYPYRPAFTCMGMFLLVCALLNHEALVFGRISEPKRQGLRVSARVRSAHVIRPKGNRAAKSSRHIGITLGR